MSSRVERYIESSNTYTSSCSRVDRNARLYRQVYGKYEDLDNLPIEDNTDEIDMERLKELVSGNNSSLERLELRDSLNILDTRERKIDENKIYDINKMLEKAKNDNNKLKDSLIRESIVNKSILSTLEGSEISLEEIKKASEEYENNILEYEKKEELSMTREFKFKELSDEVERFNSNPLTSNVMSDNELSFDLFEELKPTGNTIVTKPVKEENLELREMDFHSTDTKDIDVIKESNANLEEFFTNSYEFSKKDFAKLSEDDDFFELKKDNNVLKIILLVLAIIVFIVAIVYFVWNYGLGV